MSTETLLAFFYHASPLFALHSPTSPCVLGISSTRRRAATSLLLGIFLSCFSLTSSALRAYTTSRSTQATLTIYYSIAAAISLGRALNAHWSTAQASFRNTLTAQQSLMSLIQLSSVPLMTQQTVSGPLMLSIRELAFFSLTQALIKDSANRGWG